MKRILYTFSLLFFLTTSSFAQEFAQPSFGASYSQQDFFRLDDLSSTTLTNQSWDLAFNTGSFSVGAHFNEASSISFTGPTPYLELYLAPTTNFEDTVELEAIRDTLGNDEISWESGALNSVADPENSLDYGWGAYNTGTHAVEGNRVFVLKLWDDTYRKLKIVSMASGIITMKHAMLDGSDEQTVTIDKANFSDSPFAFFSFDTGTATASPAGWDLLFTRYVGWDVTSEGDTLPYKVSGVLLGPEVEIARASGVDPYDVDYADYADAFVTEVNTIGWNWKSFSFTEGWIIDEQLAYFIKGSHGHLWKIIFIDFEGSSTGVVTIEVEDLGPVAAVGDPESNFSAIGVFPNPVEDHLTISMELKQKVDKLSISITDLSGKVIWESDASTHQGLNVLELNRLDFPSGNYILNLRTNEEMSSHKIVKL